MKEKDRNEKERSVGTKWKDRNEREDQNESVC
jgi:hypothetical protein